MVAPVFHASSLTELVSLRAQSQGDEPFVHTGAPEFGDELLTLTYSDVERAVDRLAAYYANLGLQPTCPPGQIPPERVIAVLVSTAVDESLLEIALAKLGLTSLLLSVNNSVAAVAHLCKVTSSTHLIYGPRYAAVAAEAQRILAAEGSPLAILADKRFPLWGEGGVRGAKITAFPARLTPEQESRRTCVILHSSGSTGFPKPVYVTHYGMVANAAVSVPKTGFSALPLFHGFGHFSIFRCLYHGKAFTLLPPHWPITAANIVRCIEQSPTPPVQHFAVPYVLKLLSESEEGVASLAAMEAVSFAGAAVPDDLGDRLVEAGVPLYSQYGTTETGALLTSRRDYHSDKAWNWLRVEGLVAKYLDLVPHGSGTYEAVVRDGWPGKVMSNREDGAYCTKDLFVKHPEHDNWVKYVGRLDDTLTQTLGEKTNPVPIELDVRGNSPLIQECIVFGDGRPQVGALLLPSDAGADLSRDRQAFIREVWPVIADANSRAPSHSRLLPEMIEVLQPGTEIPVATKMSILRPACYRKFGPIIDAVYARFENGHATAKRTITDGSEMEAYLEATTRVVLGSRAGDDLDTQTDLFVYGVDSLQATRIRNAIQKEVDLGSVTLGQNIVYEHPTIAQLSVYILSLTGRCTNGINGVNGHDSVQDRMVAMAEKWAARVSPPAPASATAPSAHTVLVTGATGSLGAHLVDSLLQRPDVVRVICLSRAASHEASRDRLRHSFAARKLAPPLDRIDSFAADITQPCLGLSEAEYAAVRASITAVVHAAWPVNFNLGLASFEPSVGAAVALLNLTQASPLPRKPAFLFASTVGTMQGGVPGQDGVDGEGAEVREVREVFPRGPASASGTGYAQSKWVVETVLARTRGTVLRIGQLCGDARAGVWSDTEAWPLMFRSAGATGALPALAERVGWLPFDFAARAIVEVALGPASPASTDGPSACDPGDAVFHIVNRHTAPFSAVLAGLRAAGVAFDAVPRHEWLRRLEASDPDVGANPTRKLLPFYARRIGQAEERAEIVFSTARAEARSRTIAGLGPVDEALVGRWVRAWRESGFLP